MKPSTLSCFTHGYVVEFRGDAANPMYVTEGLLQGAGIFDGTGRGPCFIPQGPQPGRIGYVASCGQCTAAKAVVLAYRVWPTDGEELSPLAC